LVHLFSSFLHPIPVLLEEFIRKKEFEDKTAIDLGDPYAEYFEFRANPITSNCDRPLFSEAK